MKENIIAPRQGIFIESLSGNKAVFEAARKMSGILIAFKKRLIIALLPGESSNNKGKQMNKFIVADSANCIGCHACEVACVTSSRDSWPQQRSDFLPRIRVFFNRKASSATTCRHCNDAPASARADSGAERG